VQASVRRTLRQAWELGDADQAEKLIRNPARRLEHDAPGVRNSILEGLDEILTVNRLGLPAQLRRSLACTNIIEYMNGTVRRICHNVRHWRDAAMACAGQAPPCWRPQKALGVSRHIANCRSSRALWPLMPPGTRSLQILNAIEPWHNVPTQQRPINQFQQRQGHPLGFVLSQVRRVLRRRPPSADRDLWLAHPGRII